MHRILLTKTRRDLRRRLPQFAAVAVTVMVGVVLVISSYEAYQNLRASYDRTYARLHFADVTATGGDPRQVAAAARHMSGVSAVSSRTQGDLPLRIGGDKLLGRVVGLPAGTQPAVDRVDVTSGRYLDPGDPTGVLVESHAAKTFALSPGDRLRAFDGTAWRTVTVRGVVDSAEYLWPARSRQDSLDDPHSFAVIFAPEATARSLAGPGATSQTLVRFTDDARGSATTKRAAADLRKAGAVDVTPRSEQASVATLKEDLTGFQQLGLTFPLLFLAAAAVAAYVLITRLVLSERKVIATFLAAGAPRRLVVRHYLSHGTLAGTAGAVAGLALGTLSTDAVTRAYTSALKVPDTVIEHGWPVAVAGLVFGLLVGLVGGIAPALAASREAPAEAMRGDGGTLKPPGPWSRTVARARGLPVVARLALRELTRSRRRTLATMTGTVLSLVLVLASVGMITSMRSLVSVQYGTVQQEDATITADIHASGLESSLRKVPGVARVEPVTTVAVIVSAHGRSYGTSLTGYRQDTVMHGFRTPGGGTASLPARGVLAGRAIASRLDVRVGDTVTVASPGGVSRQARLAGLLDEPIGTSVYATDATTHALTGAGVDSYQLRFDRSLPEHARDDARATISTMRGVVAYTDAKALQSQFDKYLGLFWLFAGAMLVLGAILALTVIYVTMTVNVAERTGELATLRAAGVPLRRIAGILATENLTATLLAVPVGLVAGAAAAWEALESFSSDMFHIELTLDWATLASAVVAVLAASLLSQIPAIRMVRGLDIARVVRERAQ
ncbi:FtsX-like permease family protein [Streptomyces sp. NPDC050788]|uniref:ABC transporter permease n=1 Tax=Streptomyces sp. NPDC050788 TaxID=3155041 RepID=UPI003445EB36